MDDHLHEEDGQGGLRAQPKQSLHDRTNCKKHHRDLHPSDSSVHTNTSSNASTTGSIRTIKINPLRIHRASKGTEGCSKTRDNSHSTPLALRNSISFPQAKRNSFQHKQEYHARNPNPNYKENKKQNRRSNFVLSKRKSRENSLALATYLHKRGWSLSEDVRKSIDLNETSNHQSINNTINGNQMILPRESHTLRKRALKLLETTMCQWATSMDQKPQAWQQSRVTLVTFGSYRLGAYRSDADVDLLALCPPSCTREDFFTSLVKILKSEKAIANIHPIASAYTPVLKFTIHDIHFDMLFGRVSGKANVEKLLRYQRLSLSPLLTKLKGDIAHDELPKWQDFNIEDSFLLGMEDDSEVRSANGVRVTQFLIRYVPHQDHFRIVLCAVKEWATLHGIYSNVLGFLGGVNWAIMVAYVCRRFPKQKPSTLLVIFFRIFATWNWPNPVLLEKETNSVGKRATTDTGIHVELASIGGGMKPWDPHTNPRDARSVMPIITPVYPRMNSAYNVGVSQQRRIQEELIRAAFLTQNEYNWRALYSRSDFFERYGNFLQISIRAGENPDEFTRWLRLCESRLRLLISALDSPDMSVWPYAQLMKRKIQVGNATTRTFVKGRPEAIFFIGLRFAPHVESIDLKQHTTDFLTTHINCWEGRKPEMDLRIHHIMQKNLPYDLISEYVSTHPKVIDIPNPMAIERVGTTRTENVQSRRCKKEATMKETARCSPIRHSKDPVGNSDGDTRSVSRSMNSSMPSDEGTAKCFDGTESGNTKSLSPVGNYITVDCRSPEMPPNTVQMSGTTEPSGLGSKTIKHDSQHSNHRVQLYEFLTGKTDTVLTSKTVEDVDAAFCASESHSDRSSTRSPIKKKPRNRSGSSLSE